MTGERGAIAGGFSSAVRAALLAGMLLASAGCAERYLHNAQDSFSKGAAIENLAVFGDPGGAVDRSAPAPEPLTGGAVIYYVDAREHVRKALTKERSALDKQKLTGSAYALLAIVSWRLDDLQGPADGDSAGDPCETQNHRRCAENSAKLAADLLAQQPFLKRDRFTMAILPGLLDHNRGLQKTAATPMNAGADFQSAFQNIGRGFAIIEPVMPISGKPLTTEQSLKVYGLIAQYQVLRAWSAAMTRASLPGVPPDQALTSQQRASCKAILRTKWAPLVTSNVAAVDPGGQVVLPSVRTSFERAIGDLNPGTEPCPWTL
ncbi:MAG TPA: hypothetical protein VEC60_01875 [Reyranella sp.]|nr:hypothetical protein [Reyranella sp.]